MDIFAELNKKLKENDKRWKEIDMLAKRIKEFDEPDIEDMANLLLLLVEQLRPAENTKEQIENMQIDINNLLSGFKK
jgi:hypothetical protein